jgi:hypothetical protein
MMLIRGEGHGVDPATTNNRMELAASYLLE